MILPFEKILPNQMSHHQISPKRLGFLPDKQAPCGIRTKWTFLTLGQLQAHKLLWFLLGAPKVSLFRNPNQALYPDG